MKNLLFAFVFIFSTTFSTAQEANFIAKISKTSGNLNSKFKVEFILQNGNGSQFEAPNFEDFTIVGGPSTSSNMTIINGEVTQSISYTYMLKPKKSGTLVVPAASIKVKGETLKTKKLKIQIDKNSNTEDEEENAIRENERPRQPEAFGDDFFGQFFGRPSTPSTPPKKEEPKKKRKTYSL